MNTYEIKYKSANGSVLAARVSADSVCQAVFRFLQDRDLPVLSATRTDLLPFEDMDKQYIASYTNGKDECWDIVITAKNWKEAAREAKTHENEYGHLWSVRLNKQL